MLILLSKRRVDLDFFRDDRIIHTAGVLTGDKRADERI
jgi:hypothetical protein